MCVPSTDPLEQTSQSWDRKTSKVKYKCEYSGAQPYNHPVIMITFCSLDCESPLNTPYVKTFLVTTKLLWPSRSHNYGGSGGVHSLLNVTHFLSSSLIADHQPKKKCTTIGNIYVSSKTGSSVFFLTSLRLRPLRDLSGRR